MAIKPEKTFVIGNFVWGLGPAMRPNRPPGVYDAAVEILREYSASEFIGKLYVHQANTWVPLSVYALSDFEWYKWFNKNRVLYFEMPGPENWKVLHFRQESDETGPYVAVALQHHPHRLAWQK